MYLLTLRCGEAEEQQEEGEEQVLDRKFVLRFGVFYLGRREDLLQGLSDVKNEFRSFILS